MQILKCVHGKNDFAEECKILLGIWK